MGQAVRIGYIRVSTDNPEQLAALDNQRSRIATAQVDEIIEDIESGLNQDRPGYLELLRRIDTRSVSEVVCTRLDRLGRDAAATDALIAIAAKRGVTIHCLDGGTVDAQTPQGFLLSRIATSMAEVESRMLSLRVKAGYSEGRKKKRPMRARPPWGYRKTQDGTALEPCPTEAPRAQQFLTLLRAENYRMHAASVRWHQEGRGDIPLNCNKSIKSWLLNPVLRGGLGYYADSNGQYKEVIWETHEPLMTHSEFTVMERQLEDNRRRWGYQTRNTPRLLTGLCVCTSCNRKMTYVSGRTVLALTCKHYDCANRYKTHREQVINDAIGLALSSRAETLATAVKAESPEAANLREQIAKLDAAADPDLEPAIAIKRERLAQLEQAHGPDPDLLRAFSSPEVWTHLNQQELRELYLALVEQVRIDKQGIQAVILRL